MLWMTTTLAQAMVAQISGRLCVLFVGETRECAVFESTFVEIQGSATLMTSEVSLWLL